MYARIPLDRRTFKINILIGAGPRHSDTHTLHFDVTLLIDAYRLRTIKKRGISNSVLYLVIAPKEEAVV
ncbi:MAG: hypothetical protein IME95_08940, partial [Proteobacteria bacterium]|nr:hypothetical protein [Pseudomonadota bacterium]